MNNTDKNTFLKSIKELKLLLHKLNWTQEWELRYNTCDCRFALYKLNKDTNKFEKVIECEEYFPNVYVE